MAGCLLRQTPDLNALLLKTCTNIRDRCRVRINKERYRWWLHGALRRFTVPCQDGGLIQIPMRRELKNLECRRRVILQYRGTRLKKSALGLDWRIRQRSPVTLFWNVPHLTLTILISECWILVEFRLMVSDSRSDPK